MAPTGKDPEVVSEIGGESRPQELGTKTEPRFQELRVSDHF
jgi:hypothetical protein